MKVTLHPIVESGTTNDLVFSCSVAASSNSRMRRLTYGSPCNDTAPCSTGEVCEDQEGSKICQCDTANNYELTGDNVCLPKSTGQPTLGDSCDANTQCTGANVVCSSENKCACANGFVNSNGACVASTTPTPPTSGCSIPGTVPAPPKYGNYTVKASADSGNTINDSGVTGAYFRYDDDVAIGATQVTPQTVDSTSSDKKSFTVAFDAAVDTALPRFYAEETSETEIPCTLSTDKKTATCTPTNDHMKDGKKYTIHYRTNCAKKGTTTGIEVEYESSAYAKLGSVLLIALGVFLL